MTPEERAERLRQRFLFPEAKDSFVAIVAAEIHAACAEEREACASRSGRSPATMTLTVVLGEDGWYVVTSEACPGCISQGRTLAEAIRNFADALEGGVSRGRFAPERSSEQDASR